MNKPPQPTEQQNGAPLDEAASDAENRSCNDSYGAVSKKQSQPNLPPGQDDPFLTAPEARNAPETNRWNEKDGKKNEEGSASPQKHIPPDDDEVPEDEPIAPAVQSRLLDDQTEEESDNPFALRPDDNSAFDDCRQDFMEQDLSHPADVAEHLESLPLDEQVYILASLPTESAAEALTELDEHTRVDILEKMNPDVAAILVGEMSPDDAADVLDELDEEHSDSLLSKLGSEDADEIRQLMAFDPETAGGIMNTEIVILDENLSADQAIRLLRSEISDKEIPYYAYIVSHGDILKGVLSLRDVLLLPPGISLEIAVGRQDVITVHYDEPKEEVARLISHYNFMALPVVDYEDRLLGVVSHDDIIDVIQDIASEDLLGMVGAGQDESVDTPWKESIGMRLPWLLVNMLNSVLSASVVYFFEGTIAQMAILAVFMPMVANQAGNTGQQALAIIIRQLALDKLEGRKASKAVFREMKVGLVNGFILGTVSIIGVSLFTHNLRLGLVMGGALLMDMILGATAGASIPLILKRLGRDPAQASSIFLTALTDGAGFLLFLSLATLFLL